MKFPSRTYLIALLIVIAGCARQNPESTPVCQSENTFDTIVAIPIRGDVAFVPESKYAHLPQQIAAGATERLTDYLQESRMFAKAKSASSCMGRAVAVESKIVRLVHHRSAFHGRIEGRIFNCENETTIHRFEESDSENERKIDKMPAELAKLIFSAVKKGVPCRSSQ
jgi:hypothetical protein